MQRHKLKNGKILTLREATPEDAERTIAYVETIAGESNNLGFGVGEFNITVEQEKRFIAETAQSANALFLLAEVEQEIVSVLTFSAGKRPRTAHVGEFGISVLKKYWGMGIGSKMLAYLLAWAEETGTVRKINLRVLVDNLRAIRLYEKFGFKVEGVQTRDLCINGQFYDAFFMGRLIEPK
jgi:RimJ/RimL family protein N-acetyltransferase